MFSRFLAVFARPDHPLALFLDDLQWLDLATIQLLEHLTAEVRYLLLVGAYRDNEVGPFHPLVELLEKLDKAGGSIQKISLGPLSRSDMDQLVVDSLHCQTEHAKPLAELIYEKTGGNPFFTIQFFKAMPVAGMPFTPLASLGRCCLEANLERRLRHAPTRSAPPARTLLRSRLPRITAGRVVRGEM